MDLFELRRAGVVAHITSLPGPASYGTLGEDALRFVDFLADCGFSIWQVLPLGPIHHTRSPYQCQSVHAGEPDLISFERDVLERAIEGPVPELGSPASVDLTSVGPASGDLGALEAVRHAFDAQAPTAAHQRYQAFRQETAAWLDDFALFRVARKHFDSAPWWEWPEPIRNRDQLALDALRDELSHGLELERFAQYLFRRQWLLLRDYARAKGVYLFGDLPIFVAHDSADVWAERRYFQLDRNGQPTVVAGVPPDYFSEDGQLWGNPLYNWPQHRTDGFRWWRRRVESQLALYDLFRIDHFRGFAAHWEIPASADTAKAGKWVTGPGRALFAALEAQFGALPVVAEDLGVITDDVIELRDTCGFPGMKIMQFAFGGGDDNPYLPKHHIEDCVVYSGTHDNDTTFGWFAALGEDERSAIKDVLGDDAVGAEAILSAACESRASLTMLPLQDVLRLGSEHRMNTPGSVEGNWQWRFNWQQACSEHTRRLHAQLRRCDRLAGH
ncbi:MAG: 4-alpha-glucanotransferase [Pseudomonadota bacterium]